MVAFGTPDSTNVVSDQAASPANLVVRFERDLCSGEQIEEQRGVGRDHPQSHLVPDWQRPPAWLMV